MAEYTESESNPKETQFIPTEEQQPSTEEQAPDQSEQQVPNQEPPLKKLWQGLFDRQMYDKSYHEFV